MNGNVQKYETYKARMENLKRAMKCGYFLESILIEYAVIEDRVNSLLSHAGKGTSQKLHKKCEKIVKARECDDRFGKALQKYISDDLIRDLDAWRVARNEIVHDLMKKPYNAEEFREVAEDGLAVVKLLSNRVKCCNRVSDKLAQKKA